MNPLFPLLDPASYPFPIKTNVGHPAGSMVCASHVKSFRKSFWSIKLQLYGVKRLQLQLEECKKSDELILGSKCRNIDLPFPVTVAHLTQRPVEAFIVALMQQIDSMYQPFIVSERSSLTNLSIKNIEF
jgi:hypothetical protein